jgi:hypothetical protein
VRGEAQRAEGEGALALGSAPVAPGLRHALARDPATAGALGEVKARRGRTLRVKLKVVPTGGLCLARENRASRFPSRQVVADWRTPEREGIAEPPPGDGAAVTATPALWETVLPAESLAVTVTVCCPVAEKVCDGLAPVAVPSPKLQANDTGLQTSNACAEKATGAPTCAVAGIDTPLSWGGVASKPRACATCALPWAWSQPTMPSPVSSIALDRLEASAVASLTASAAANAPPAGRKSANRTSLPPAGAAVQVSSVSPAGPTDTWSLEALALESPSGCTGPGILAPLPG